MDDPTCSINDCQGPVKARGWCSKHYWRWGKFGDPLREPPEHPATCRVADCEKKARSLGYCQMHYSRWFRHGDLETHRPAIKPNSEVNYFTLHERLRKARGSAEQQQCVRCGVPAAQWAQIHGEDPFNFDSYVPMCYSCHRKYDTYPSTREKNRHAGYWTPEKRAEHSRVMTEWWAKRRRPQQQSLF